MNETERNFEEAIAASQNTGDGGCQLATDTGYRSDESKGMALDIITLTDFIKST